MLSAAGEEVSSFGQSNFPSHRPCLSLKCKKTRVKRAFVLLKLDVSCFRGDYDGQLLQHGLSGQEPSSLAVSVAHSECHVQTSPRHCTSA